MAQASHTSHARVYWLTWAALLAVTLVMLLVDGAELSRGLLVTVLLVAMAVKAGLIAGNFMHLRHERSGIIWTVVLGLFALGVILWALMVPDAARIHDMVTGR